MSQFWVTSVSKVSHMSGWNGVSVPVCFTGHVIVTGLKGYGQLGKLLQYFLRW